MNLLVDTHVAIWWLDRPDRLSAPARAMISDPGNRVFISAASVWEIELKRAKGKLEVPDAYWPMLAAEGFEELSVTAKHARATSALPPHHADPFDRLLVAQAGVEQMVLLSRDAWIAQYNVPSVVA